MRITFQMLSKGPMRNVYESLERYTGLQAQAGSMKNFEKPSDNPLGVMKAMAFKTQLNQNEIYRTNTANAKMYTDMVDSTLISVKEIIDTAKSLALEMRSSTAEVGDVRQSAAREVEGLINDLS